MGLWPAIYLGSWWFLVKDAGQLFHGSFFICDVYYRFIVIWAVTGNIAVVVVVCRYVCIKPAVCYIVQVLRSTSHLIVPCNLSLFKCSWMWRSVRHVERLHLTVFVRVSKSLLKLDMTPKVKSHWKHLDVFVYLFFCSSPLSFLQLNKTD